jgi:hypothetical protein
MTSSSCSSINVDGIFNVDQGYFRNTTTSNITSYPSLNLAIISNDCADKTPDVIIGLNPVYLNWNHFSTLFFKPPSGAFYISPSNINVGAISFVSQTYETTYNKNVTFNLADQVRKAWSKKFSKPEIAISPKVNIELERQCFLTKSLGSIYGDFVGLSYDEALSALLADGSITIGDSDSSAIVKFLIGYQYYYKALDIVLLTTFTYVTSIPCYKNTYPFSDDCSCPYSNDTKIIDRSNLDLSDDASLISDYESKAYDSNSKSNIDNILEEYSIASESNNSKVNNTVISAISNYINKDAESVSTSDW